MGKHLDTLISHVSIPQINLDISTGFTLSSASSALNIQKYHMDDINEPTPRTLHCVKGKRLRIIKVVDAIVMATHIMHGCEFEDLDYPDKHERIEMLKDAKGNFILRPHKDIIQKIHSSSIVSPQNKKRMRVLKLLKIPYAALLDLLLYLKILHKLLKIDHLHNLLSIILHHVLLFQCLLITLAILFKIHHLHNHLDIILYYVRLLPTIPLLLKIHQLNKLFNIVLHHVLLLQCLLRTIPLLFKNVPPTHPLEHHSLQHQSPTHTTTTRPQRVRLVWHQRGMGRVIPYIRDELIHPTKHQMG
jgi:hypothetical protein